MQANSEPLDVFQRLQKIERQHDLFSYRVDGWSAWRILRHAVHRRVFALPLATASRSSVTRSAEAMRATLKLCPLLLFGKHRELLVKTCRSALRVRQGERFRDVYFDGLIERGHTCLKLEENNSPDFDQQAAAAWRPADLDPVAFTFWGRVLGAIFPVRARSYCTYVQGLVRGEFQVALPASWLLMRLSTVYWQARLYALVLRRVRPRAVLVADTGEYALRIACHRLGVRFIELQHGVFDVTHPDAVPAWVPGGAGELVLPDVLACRGAYWVEQLADTRQGSGPARAVGNDIIDLARHRKQGRVAGGNVSLVLTSQGLDSVRLAQWIANMIAHAPADVDWHLWIKLHPIYDSRSHEFDELGAHPRVTVIGGGHQPNVFDLLADADLHLSIASACHFDAAALGVPSVVVPLAGHEAMLAAVDATQIFMVRSPAEVWALARRQPVDPGRTHRYSTPGFVDNLEALLS